MGKKGFTSLFLVFATVFLISFVSAEIIITQQPSEIYNLGEIVSVPVTIKTSSAVSGSFSMDLICDGKTTNFHKTPLSLSQGEEKKATVSLILTKDIIGNLKGTCRVKAIFANENVLSNNFKVSDSIVISLKTQNFEFNPGDAIYFEGEALKENGKTVNGFVEVNLNYEDENATHLGTVSNGFFSINFATPKNTAAGSYLAEINVYEKSPGDEKTNLGSLDSIIKIRQIPTNLEIVFENKTVEPGTNIKVKAVLRDQTGENIESTAIITVKDSSNKILEQTEKQTDEFLEYPIKYNQKPSEWRVFAVSNRLSSELGFVINSMEDAKVEIMNKTLVVTNTGNVPYNKTLLVKIGEESVNLDIFLNVDETKKYLLTAPDGEYLVQIVSGGLSQISESLTLTGKAIDVKEASRGLIQDGLSLAWIFVILILAFVAFIIFRKGYKKSFIGYIIEKRRNKESVKVSEDGFLTLRNKANFSLSMKGEKQNVTLVCMKIKNFGSLDKKDTSLKETFDKIVSSAESVKAYVYESHGNIFFIFSPVVTKTFRNGKTSIHLMNEIQNIVKSHNKLYRQKIDFGLSVDSGEVLIKVENGEMQFMVFGNLINHLKKIASHSDGESLIGEKIKDNAATDAKFEKKTIDGTNVYKVKELKDKPSGKFINELVKRIERD
jgi:hypothetical protein